jgi:hypothetical protein
LHVGESSEDFVLHVGESSEDFGLHVGDSLVELLVCMLEAF